MKLFTGLRQFNAPVDTFEQGFADFAFQCLDLVTDSAGMADRNSACSQ